MFEFQIVTRDLAWRARWGNLAQKIWIQWWLYFCHGRDLLTHRRFEFSSDCISVTAEIYWLTEDLNSVVTVFLSRQRSTDSQKIWIQWWLYFCHGRDQLTHRRFEFSGDCISVMAVINWLTEDLNSVVTVFLSRQRSIDSQTQAHVISLICWFV